MCLCEIVGCPCDSQCPNPPSADRAYGIVWIGTRVCDRCLDHCRMTYPEYVLPAHQFTSNH